VKQGGAGAADPCAQGWGELLALVEQESGIALSAEKLYLALARLRPLVQELKLAHLGELAASARDEASGELLGRVIDAVATHETSFFRDADVFHLLREEILPELLAGPTRPRIWCAACSTGQEPYSLAMSLLEANAPASGPRAVDLVATDISVQVLFTAMQGIYDEFALSRGLSAERRERFMHPLDRGRWQIRPEVRALVFYQQANLIETQPALGRFDLIMLRNVLIYFTDETRAQILARMAEMTRPGGYLVLGSSETSTRPPAQFAPLPGVSRPIFRRLG
jgi:chemotaxis protein methyltransferase CheR